MNTIKKNADFLQVKLINMHRFTGLLTDQYGDA